MAQPPMPAPGSCSVCLGSRSFMVSSYLAVSEPGARPEPGVVVVIWFAPREKALESLFSKAPAKS